MIGSRSPHRSGTNHLDCTGFCSTTRRPGRAGVPGARPGSARAPPVDAPHNPKKGAVLSVVTMRELLEAGVHFGHQTRRWNPKMKRFIFTERGGIYITALQQTLELVQEAHDFARNIASRGGSLLFVGTKKQAQDAVRDHGIRGGRPDVNNRWLRGGVA